MKIICIGTAAGAWQVFCQAPAFLSTPLYSRISRLSPLKKLEYPDLRDSPVRDESVILGLHGSVGGDCEGTD